MHWAANSRRCDIVQLLIKHGADVNACSDFDGTALHIACEGRNLDMVMLLLSQRVDCLLRNKVATLRLLRVSLTICIHRFGQINIPNIPRSCCLGAFVRAETVTRDTATPLSMFLCTANHRCDLHILFCVPSAVGRPCTQQQRGD